LPGQFEQRTGIPFVSYQVLAGSVCATNCAEYEDCYNSSSRVPIQPCKPRSLKKSLSELIPEEALTQKLFDVQQQRASAKFDIITAGGKMDQALFKAGLWRECWNARQRLRTDVAADSSPRPGSVYLCNIVKCRSAIEDPKSVDGLKDVAPKKAEADACRQWLDIQIYIMQPMVIVALGNPAVHALTKLEDPKILSIRGKMFTMPEVGIPVIADVHPSFIIRQGEKGVESEYTKGLIETFERAKNISLGVVEETTPLDVVYVEEKEVVPAISEMVAIPTFSE
jgi:uracil-DNA glycosylase family 4